MVFHSITTRTACHADVTEAGLPATLARQDRLQEPAARLCLGEGPPPKITPRRPWWLPNGVAAIASKRSCPMKATGQPREPPRDRPGAEMWPKRLPKGCPQSSKNGVFSASIATLAFSGKHTIYYTSGMPRICRKRLFAAFSGSQKKDPPQWPHKYLKSGSSGPPEARLRPQGAPAGSPQGPQKGSKLLPSWPPGPRTTRLIFQPPLGGLRRPLLRPQTEPKQCRQSLKMEPQERLEGFWMPFEGAGVGSGGCTGALFACIWKHLQGETNGSRADGA